MDSIINIEYTKYNYKMCISVKIIWKVSISIYCLYSSLKPTPPGPFGGSLKFLTGMKRNDAILEAL